MSVYIKLFDTTSQYNAYTADTSNFILPNVSLALDDTDKVYYNPSTPPAPAQYRWYPSGTTCVGYDLYNQSIRQVSNDGGVTWTNVVPNQFSATTLIEENSETCGYSPAPTSTTVTCIYNPDARGSGSGSGNGGESGGEGEDAPSEVAVVLFADGYDSCIETMYVDDYEETVTYQIDLSTGETHTVEFVLTGTSINNYLFSGCLQLISAEIDSGATSIGDYTFSGCTSLTSCTIGSGVTSIGYSAFDGCSSLDSITLPDNVTSIGNGAFQNCSGLTSINIPSGVTNIDNYTFMSCSGLTSIEIPSGVTSIGEYAFYYCYSLTSVTIPNSVTSIGNGAFTSCSGLTEITIPNSVTGIDAYAFNSCDSLTGVTIGSGVTSIGDSAFAYCISLTSITSNAMTAPIITSGTFESIANGSYGTLYVPSGSTGYDTWMGSGEYYLGYYEWTKREQ